jgi:hypothetical protein
MSFSRGVLHIDPGGQARFPHRRIDGDGMIRRAGSGAHAQTNGQRQRAAFLYFISYPHISLSSLHFIAQCNEMVA